MKEILVSPEKVGIFLQAAAVSFSLAGTSSLSVKGFVMVVVEFGSRQLPPLEKGLLKLHFSKLKVVEEIAKMRFLFEHF